MKIYKLSVQTEIFRYYFCATKGGAEALRRTIKAENKADIEAGLNVVSIHDADIEELEFPATRQGVAELLNDFVAQTCMNEG